MKLKKRSKKALTLLEIMIVIFLIGLIGSVVGYNMKGSLDEGKAFKTKQAMAQIHDILLLEIAKGVPTKDVLEKKEKYLQNSGLVKNVNDLLKDGWGKELDIKAKGLSDISIHSTSLTNYENKKRKALGEKEITENDEVDETES